MTNGAIAQDSGGDRPGRGVVARRATIADVAREAGVSTSAVSKVLRDAYGVSADMRERVTRAIDELGYRPHAGARAMRGRSFTIGVALTELDSPFQTEVAQRIGAALEDSPYQEILIPAGVTPARQRRAVEALLDRHVDGLVLIAPHMPASQIIEFASRVPTVCVALHGESDVFDSVCDDDALGARLMVDHLVALGHRRIIHSTQESGPTTAPHALSHTARQRGYVSAMTDHGLEPWVVESNYSEEGGYAAAMRVLRAATPPTAFFAGADIAALGALRAADELGLRVPEDLTVTGYDDIYAAGLAGVRLTTINQSSDETGAAAAELLLSRLTGRTVTEYRLLEPHLIVRNTDARPSA